MHIQDTDTKAFCYSTLCIARPMSSYRVSPSVRLTVRPPVTFVCIETSKSNQIYLQHKINEQKSNQIYLQHKINEQEHQKMLRK